MKSSNEHFNFPSGVQLPFILRQKVQQARAKAAQEAQSTTDSSITSGAGSGEQPPKNKFMTAMIPGGGGMAAHYSARAPLSAELLDRAFSTRDLETLIIKSSVALAEVQKQIHRGEEAYYEETFSHGNIFKGWEGYLDAKDVSAASSSSNSGPTSGSGSRRVPQGMSV